MDRICHAYLTESATSRPTEPETSTQEPQSKPSKQTTTTIKTVVTAAPIIVTTSTTQQSRTTAVKKGSKQVILLTYSNFKSTMNC
jgi:hypothetical protein